MSTGRQRVVDKRGEGLLAWGLNHSPCTVDSHLRCKGSEETLMYSDTLFQDWLRYLDVGDPVQENPFP